MKDNILMAEKSSPGKALREAYARFFEDPSRDKLRDLLEGHDGEFRNLDFKEEWPKHSPLAKQILAIFNSGGGCLIAGIQEKSDGTLEPVGIASFTDKADLTNGLKNYIPKYLLEKISFHDFSYDSSDYKK